MVVPNGCTDELRINLKHLLACGGSFLQIDRKQCTFQKWFYNWSCTLSKVVEQFFFNFFLTATPRHGYTLRFIFER